MHQQDLALLQATALEHIVPDGEEGLRQRRGLGHREAGRHRQRVALVDEAILRVAAARCQRADRVADLPACNGGPDRGDLARHLQAGKIGRALRRRVGALALQHVGTVDARRVDPDQDLARPGFGHGAQFRFQHHRPARLGDRDRRHLRGKRCVVRHASSCSAVRVCLPVAILCSVGHALANREADME